MLETIPQTAGLSFSPVKKANSPMRKAITPSAKGRIVLGNITNTAHQRTPTRKGKATVSPKRSFGSLAKPVVAPIVVAEVPAKENSANGEDKKVIRYEIDFLKSFRDLPVCSVVPSANGVTPMDIINQYNEEYEKREALEREQQTQEFLARCLTEMSIQSPKKVWRVKQPAKSPMAEAVQHIDAPVIELPMSPATPMPSIEEPIPTVSSTPKPDSSDQEEEEDDEKEPVDLERRLASRLKQVSYGKNTQGYANYLVVIPREKRKRVDPSTPDANQNCSKRSFDGQIRKWRRALHQFDDIEQVSAVRRKLVF